MFSGSSVLLVYDISTIRRCLAIELTTELNASTVIEAESVEEGLTLLRKNPGIGWIFSDYEEHTLVNMRLGAAAAEREIPLVIMTSDNSEKFLGEARRSGVTDYLIKPFTVNDFVEKARRMYMANARTDAMRIISASRNRVVVSWSRGHDNIESVTSLLDISKTGCRVKMATPSDHCVRIYDTYHLSVVVEEGATIEIEGELMRTESDKEDREQKLFIFAAFHFVAIDDDSRGRLDRFVRGLSDGVVEKPVIK